jgi:hypothetical protein
MAAPLAASAQCFAESIVQKKARFSASFRVDRLLGHKEARKTGARDATNPREKTLIDDAVSSGVLGLCLFLVPTGGRERNRLGSFDGGGI